MTEEITEVQNTSVIYEDNQGVIFLAKNRQVGIHTKHINIHHNFLRDMVGDKDVDIHYIQSEDKPEYIMTKQICKQILRGTPKGSQRENSGS